MPIPLEQRLIVNQWLFGLFGIDSTDGWVISQGKRVPLLNAFRHRYQIDRDTLEGLDTEKQHHFLGAILGRLVPEMVGVTEDELRTFDNNIVRHTEELNDARLRHGKDRFDWKYFQYLALLFTEIYLDRYFRSPEALAAELNAHIDRFNDGKTDAETITKFPEGDAAASGLNMLAYWCATGSGKTHLMHANIRQYQHYVRTFGKERDIRGVILLTPNERLSMQHRDELAEAGIEGEIFGTRGAGLFAGKAVEIIDIHKLAETKGEKTVPVESFLSNNLVLVDEGHVGLRSGEERPFLQRRNALSEKGFSFEYSATFKQALSNNAPLSERYGRSIVFDYSYRFFYGDGYGKDYRILNLDQAAQNTHLDTYLTGCLLTAYQQLRLYDDKTAEMRSFNIERPLWIFVGSSVNAVRREGGRDVSDVTSILLFLARFLANRTRFEQLISEVIHQGLVSHSGTNIFANKFVYLVSLGLNSTEIYADILSRLFDAVSGGSLHVEHLKGGEGELTLKVGDNDPFGLINVGDAKKLFDLCDNTDGIVATEREFGGSLFRSLNDRDNRINLLIGSRRFTEGWNSWRVSNIGLMKIGATEGAQIIQLFGRGVRNKGYNWSLRRSREANLPPGIDRPQYIDLLETLNVFGIEADYIERFREYLKEEGVPTGEVEVITLPVINNLGGTEKLKMIRLKSEINGQEVKPATAFRKLAPIPELSLPNDTEHWLLRNRVQLNWYPRVRSVTSGKTDATPIILNKAKLDSSHVSMLDVNKLWLSLVRLKNEKGWYNYNIPRSIISSLLNESSWYDLFLPSSYLDLSRYENVRIWEEIAESLLQKYTLRFYEHERRNWEGRHLEYGELRSGDVDFGNVNATSGLSEYAIIIDPSEEQFIIQLRQFADHFSQAATATLPFSLSGTFASVDVFYFERHLYTPLIFASGATIQIKPVSLNEGEKKFIEDLKDHYEANLEDFEDKQLFLLRNQSRGRGTGFFEASNFHPDFILWIVQGDKQHIAFIDPKGLRNIGPKEAKVEFYKTIKEIETRLGDPNVNLHSFIVSNTAFHSMLWDMSKEEMHERNICFQDEDRETYIKFILDRTA